MGYTEGDKMVGKKIDYVFVGSCTNGRIEDFRVFANLDSGSKFYWLVIGPSYFSLRWLI